MTWFRSLSSTGKSLSVIGAVIIGTLTFAVAFGGHVGLPAQVDMNVKAITRDSLEITGQQRMLKDVLCILTQAPGANPLECVTP